MRLAALRRACGVTLRFAPPRRREIEKIVGVGLPLASSGAVFTLVTIALGRVASGCGPHHLAAMSLGQKFEAVAFTVCEGFGSRASCRPVAAAVQARRADEELAARRRAGAGGDGAVRGGLLLRGRRPPGSRARRKGGATADPEMVAAAALDGGWAGGVLSSTVEGRVAEGAFTGGEGTRATG